MWRCLRQFLQSSSSQESTVSSYGARTLLSGSRRLGGSGDRSFILAYFLTVGSDAPTALAIDAIGSPPLALLRISSILSTPIIPLWPSSRRKPKQRHCSIASPGKKLPVRSLGMRGVSVPTQVASALSR